MAKWIIWTETARNSRREILKFWIKHNKSATYSIKLSELIRRKVLQLASPAYAGKPTDFKDVRVTLVSHFSIFFRNNVDEIIIVGIWDNRRSPDDLKKNLEL